METIIERRRPETVTPPQQETEKQHISSAQSLKPKRPAAPHFTPNFSAGEKDIMLTKKEEEVCDSATD